MEYINDININEAVIHILDSNAGEPILNEYTLDLNEDIYKFAFKHIEKCLKDEELKYAKFNAGRNIVKELVKDNLNGIDNNIIDLSKELAKQMFAIMNGNANIPSSDLIVASIVTDKGPMIAILKMDYIKNFTHRVEFVENKIGIGIVPQAAGLPGSSQKIQKAAFIKPIREGETYNLMVLDKQKNNKKEEEYGANYFINNFLGCTMVDNERDDTRQFLKATEMWTRENFTIDAEQAERVRRVVRDNLKDKEVINIDELSKELFKNEVGIREDFSNFVKSQGVGEIEVDKVWVEKKLSRVKLKIGSEIDICMNEEVYKDKSKFEIKRNGDGSINIIIKQIKSYIEK